MWKCINCDKENPDHQGICACGYDRTVEYTSYFTLTQLTREEIDKYSLQAFGNKNVKEWMDWAASIKQEILEMEESVGEEVIEQMKKYYEQLRGQQIMNMEEFVHSFRIGDKVAEDICDEEVKKTWLKIDKQRLPEDVRWNLEGNLWLFGVGRQKDYKEAVHAYIKSAQLGNDDALVNIGNCYVYGKYLVKDLESAKDCYKEAQELGNSIARLNLKEVLNLQSKDKEQPWKENILMRDWGVWKNNEERSLAKVLGSNIARRDILSVTILDTLADMPRNSWDVSQERNRKVMAWVKPNGTKYDLYIAGKGGINAKNCSNLFGGYINVERIDLNGHFHTDYAEDIICLFDNCHKLRELDVSTLKTSNATNMRGVFGECKSLTTIDVSNFDTSNVVTMYAMFYRCSELKELDVSGFDTSKVTDMSYMFTSCEQLKSLNVSNFNTSKVTAMYAMFGSCKSLKKLNLTNFDTSQVENMGWMFWQCSALTELDVSNFDTSKVTDMSAMFRRCTSMKKLNISTFNTVNVKDMSWMFYGCFCVNKTSIAHFNMRNVTNKKNMMGD